MVADRVLSRLEGVKRTSTGSFLARCPAHDDRSPSLALRETDDGRLLLHCFGGCAVEDVLGALSLDFGDLYPDSAVERGKPERRPFPLADVLRALTLEIDLAVIYASKMAAGEALSDGDRQRLLLAANRINTAASEVWS